MLHKACRAVSNQIIATFNSTDDLSQRRQAIEQLTHDYLLQKRDNPGTFRYSPIRADDAQKHRRILHKGDRLRSYVERSLKSPVASDWIRTASANLARQTHSQSVTVAPSAGPRTQIIAAPVMLPVPGPQPLPAPAGLPLPAPLMQLTHGQPPVIITRVPNTLGPARIEPVASAPAPAPAATPIAESTPSGATSDDTIHDFLTQNFPQQDESRCHGEWFRGATFLGKWQFDDGCAEDEAFFQGDR